jgi:hypothetical protein
MTMMKGLQAKILKDIMAEMDKAEGDKLASKKKPKVVAIDIAVGKPGKMGEEMPEEMASEGEGEKEMEDPTMEAIEGLLEVASPEKRQQILDLLKQS